MRYGKLIVLCFAGVFLTACANHTKNYLKNGREIAPIVVPSDVPVLKQHDYYPIPAAPQAGSVKSVSLKPPTLQK